MPKLFIGLLVFFLVSALTSCSASRPLSKVSSLSTDESDSNPVTSKSRVVLSASAPPATESRIISAEQEEARIVSDSVEAVNDAGFPCMEVLEDSNVVGERPCHRRLGDGTSFAMLDYGGSLGNASPNPKVP